MEETSLEPRLRRGDNIRMEVKGNGVNSVRCVRLSQDGNQCWDCVNSVMNCRLL
jgi:hypothetical protein